MFLHDAATSVFRPSDYAGFARRPVSRGVVYLLLLALPLALLGAFRLGGAVTQVTGVLIEAAAKSPDFRIVNGLLEFDGPQPYYLVSEGQVIGVVDTSGATTRAELAGRHHYILILRDRIIVRNGPETRELAFADLSSLGPQGEILSRDLVVTWLETLSGLGVFLGGLWLVFSVAAKFVAAFLLALVALLIASGRRRTATLDNTWNIACHALTLPLIVGFIRVLVQADIRAFGLFYWGAALVYCAAATGLLPPASGPEASGRPREVGPPQG